jgi:hypothetical protein
MWLHDVPKCFFRDAVWVDAVSALEASPSYLIVAAQVTVERLASTGRAACPAGGSARVLKNGTEKGIQGPEQKGTEETLNVEGRAEISQQKVLEPGSCLQKFCAFVS